MRIKARFVFPLAYELEDAFYARINMPMRQGKIRDTLRVVEVYKDTEQFAIVTEVLKEFGINCEPDESYEFNKVEMEAAPFLRMCPSSYRGGYPQPENGIDDYLSVSYDPSTGCPYCTTGRQQIKPLRLRSNTNLGKTTDISGVWWVRQFVVSKRLRTIIEDAQLTGCEFWPVIKHKTGEYFDDIFQLRITNTLPPMATETTFYKNDYFFGVPVCPNGHSEVILKGLAYYHSDVLQNLTDFAWTAEYIGSRSNRWPLPFMSQRAYRIFKENKIRGIRCEPAIVLPSKRRNTEDGSVC